MHDGDKKHDEELIWARTKAAIFTPMGSSRRLFVPNVDNAAIIALGTIERGGQDSF